MSFEFKLAVKYFRAKRKSLARFTSIVAVVGIAVGVASLIIAQSLANGFQDEMRDKILANTAHISIVANDDGNIPNWQTLKNNLQTVEDIREISESAIENTLLTSPNNMNYAVLRVNSNFKFQTSNPNEIQIAVGTKLAEKSGLQINDEAEIITLENDVEMHRKPVRVIQTFETGLYDYDAVWIYISPENFARLNGATDFTPKIINISVGDIFKSDETAVKIREIVGENFKVVDWQETNKPLFEALSLEKKVSLAIISLIIFIAALNITTTLALLVNERRLDIAILRTCGARSQNLLKIFLLEGLFLSFSGIFCGLILGLLGCFTGNYFKLIHISEEVYSLNYIPFHPHFPSILLIILMTFLISMAATTYPAIKASRIKPLENLRTQ